MAALLSETLIAVVFNSDEERLSLASKAVTRLHDRGDGNCKPNVPLTDRVGTGRFRSLD